MIAICSNGHITGTRECPMCGSVRFERIPVRQVLIATPTADETRRFIGRRFREREGIKALRAARASKPPFKQWRKIHRDKPALMAVLRAARRAA